MSSSPSVEASAECLHDLAPEEPVFEPEGTELDESGRASKSPEEFAELEVEDPHRLQLRLDLGELDDF